MEQRHDRALLVTNYHLFRECLVNGLAVRISNLQVDEIPTFGRRLPYRVSSR